MRNWRFLLKNTIAFRLFVIYFVVISVPLFLYGFLSYSLSARNAEADYIRNKVNISSQIMRNIDENVLVLQKQSASLFLINKEINYLLNADPTDRSDTFFEVKERLDNFFLAVLQMNDKLNGISLLDAEGEVKYAINIQGKNSISGSEKEEIWFKETLALNGAPYFIDPHTNDFILYLTNETKPTVISVAQSIMDYYANRTIGVLLVDQNTQQFFDDIATVNLQQGEQVAIISRTGKLIYSNIPLNEPEKQAILDAVQSEGQTPARINLDGRQELLIASKPSQYGFQVISLLPVAELQKKSAYLKNMNLIMLPIVTGIVFFISIAVSYMFVKPLRRMMPSFKKLEMGIFSTRVPVKGTHELAQISSAFNHMVQNIENLINQKYEANLLRKQAEFSALQSQINPHFLYNTLYATKSVIDRNEYDKASAMIQNLSEIFRYSLNQGSSSVSLREEIDHIRKYLYLHEIRFADKYTVHYDIDESLWNCRLLRLTLQPIVENAIEHGLKEKSFGGEIRISAKASGDKWLIYIYDNGRGFSEQALSHFNTLLKQPYDEPLSSMEHIGIRNVNSRIQLQYGQEFGLKIGSKSGLHTTIKITLPLQRTQEADM